MATSPNEDAILAERVTGGDRAAEAELSRKLFPRARAFGLKHLRDEAAANDLAQHATLALIEALRAGRVTDLEQIGGYLFGICKRTATSWKSGERRRTALLERFGAAFDGVAEIRDEAIDRVRLAGCLEHLTPRARTVVALTFFADRTSDEIAAELHTSVGAVRVMRHRALTELHGCMEGA